MDRVIQAITLQLLLLYLDSLDLDECYVILEMKRQVRGRDVGTATVYTAHARF